uniref:PHP domain-containing protein n=1 Tax=Magnetococcus massalia (strain MO-1) TaxID=451514 RepID=A0A1S7LKN0_MAGMO|nr:conserved protein of unknown function [Candidatus Magnetococcus massalia]
MNAIEIAISHKRTLIGKERARYFPTLAEMRQNGVPKWEFHVHSDHSDGRSDIDAIIREAQEQGLAQLAITEHTEEDLVAGPGWFGIYKADIERARSKLPPGLTLHMGLEVPVMDDHGHLELTEQMWQQCEFILGAVHAYPGFGWFKDHHIEDYDAIEREHRALMGLAGNPMVDAIAHPGGICNRFITPFPWELLEEVIIKAVANGIAIEWNPAYFDDAHTFLSLCEKHNARICLGSNAHAPEQMGSAWQTVERFLAG